MMIAQDVRRFNQHVARSTWLLLALLAMGLCFGGAPARFAELRTIAHSELERNYQRLTLLEAQALLRFGLSLNMYAAYALSIEVLFALTFFLVAAFIMWQKPTDGITIWVGVTLLTFGSTIPGMSDQLGVQYPVWNVPILVLQAIATIGCLGIFYVFPDGNFVPSWTGILALVWITLNVLWLCIPDLPYNPLYAAIWLRTPGASFMVAVLACSTGLIAQYYRYRYVATPQQRQQIKWVAIGLVAAILGGALYHMPPVIDSRIGQMSTNGAALLVYDMIRIPVAGLLVALVPICIGISILRYQLWDIDFYVNRTLVYALLMTTTISIYVVLVSSLSVLFQVRGSFVVAIVASAIVAAVFQPLRAQFQLSINRLMYGNRDDPYTVLTQFNQKLEAAIEPEKILKSIIETIRLTLKLPYAAIEITLEPAATGTFFPFPPASPAFPLLTEDGTPIGEPYIIPLTYQENILGRLIVSPRGPGDILSNLDRRLLNELARQAGVVINTVRLTIDLRTTVSMLKQANYDLKSSRARIVKVKYDERLRLQKDMHDGIASLAGQRMIVEETRHLLTIDPARANTLLSGVQESLGAIIDGTREIIYNLRPPILDRGLLAALDSLRMRYQHPKLDITLIADELPPLAPAIEYAIYMISQSALGNVVKHAQATKCDVHLWHDTALHLEIGDNGIGLPVQPHLGVGIPSMHERADELGGTLRMEPCPDGGTRLLVEIPIVMD